MSGSTCAIYTIQAVAPYINSIQVIIVPLPLYDYRNGCATGKGMAIVGCTVVHGGPMLVRLGVASAITLVATNTS